MCRLPTAYLLASLFLCIDYNITLLCIRFSLKRNQGDAPADILAAKYTAATLGSRKNGDNLEIGMIAVATGKFSARELQNVIDEPIDIGARTDWKWDPLVLERGMGDDRFIEYCKIKY